MPDAPTGVPPLDSDTLDLPGLHAAVDSARTIMALSAVDWSRHANDAWLYGILIGWDGDPADPADPGAWQLLADRHGWDAPTLVRLRRLHAAVSGFTIAAITHVQRRPTVAQTDPVDDLRGELSRMDAKASTMLGWSGAGMAIGMAVLTQLRLPLPAAVLAWSAVGLVVGAMAMLVLAARPQLDGDHGFNRYADADPSQLPGRQQTPEERNRALVWTARRLRSGYRMIRVAVHLLLTALPVAVAAGIATVAIR